MNKLELFKSKEFGELRLITVSGKEWFVAKDVAKALGYVRERDAIARHCKKAKEYSELNVGALKHSPLYLQPLQPQTKLIPESDIYRLIIRSRLLTAEKFEEWVMEEVLPSIRKTGSYSAGMPDFSNPAIAARAWADQYEENLLLGAANKEMTIQIEEQKPKVDFFDTVTTSKNTLTINEASKVLAFKNMGQNNLFKFLRKQKVLIDSYTPYQEQVKAGRMKIKMGTRTHPETGAVIATKKIKITVKGLEYIRKLLIKNGYELKFGSE